MCPRRCIPAAASPEPSRRSLRDTRTPAPWPAGAWCRGINTNGQRGNNGTTSSLFPVQATSNGAFSSTNNTAIAVGSSHSCSISNGDVYCWGLSTSARLRLGGSAITGNATTAQGAVTDARCATGSTALGNGTCPLKPDTTYYYRVKFTLDGTTATNGDWTGLKTS